MDRDAFLSRVARATKTSELPPTGGPATLPPAGRIDLVELFMERATSVNAMVHGPMEPSRVPAVAEGFVSGHHGGTFLAWDELPVPGVVSALTTAGLRRVPHDIEDRAERELAYMDLDFGITGADAGLAESGSIVLTHGKGRPRMASLIPEVHIALLDVSAIHRSLAHMAQRAPAMATSSTNLVLVTGPSRTGDIELQLNLGVHGPRIVHLVLFRR